MSFAAVLHHVEEKAATALLASVAETSMINSMPAISDKMHRQTDRLHAMMGLLIKEGRETMSGFIGNIKLQSSCQSFLVR